ncbi:hypothetical protein ACQP2F_27050 [Actinoplanes sp. CA-030573]|uniref:hypothetical protein n=1 Tax=Actinoplanes sp. CA-030573 TaxID=3239898 RepID=UPI003D92B8E4
MATAAAVVLLLGACLVGVTGIFALISVGNLRRARLLRRTPPAPIASWRPGRVAVEGRTQAGPSGLQVGPLSAAECAWFRVDATCERSGDSDRDLTWHAEGPRTPGHPTLVDATGRTVPIEPGVFAGATPATETTTLEYTHKRASSPPPWIPEAMSGRLKRGDRVTVRETRLPPGLPVFALAHLENGVLTRRGRTVFTTGGWADVIRETEADLRLMTVTIPLFFLGGIALSGGALAVLLAAA